MCNLWLLYHFSHLKKQKVCRQIIWVTQERVWYLAGAGVRGLLQVEFINRGIGGQTSTQVAERFDANIAPLQPDVLVVRVCVNDLHILIQDYVHWQSPQYS